MPGTTGGLPRGSDSIYLSDQMLRDILGPIPNLQVGYLYSFGQSVSSGRLTLDYLLPVNLTADSTIFGEAHTEFQDFWKTVQGGANNRVDLSIGGGIRKIFGESALVGVNAFFDGTRLGGTWYNSGSMGFQFAAILAGNDAVDLSLNWYGNLFNSNVLANALRKGPSNYDFQAGYSHELWEGGPDLRLYAAGYRFSAGYGVYGKRAGAELKTRDGMFVVKYEAARDRLNSTYHTVGGFVNVGVQIENLLSGENPFEMPEPIFRSPRNLRRLLTRNVDRTYAGQPGRPAGAEGPPCADGAGMWLLGPFDLASGDQFNAGMVPDITECGYQRVQIRWGAISPDVFRASVRFWYSDGRNVYRMGFFDMSTASGSVVRNVSLWWTSLSNVASYSEQSGDRLTAGAAGYVSFEFFH